MKTLHRIIVMGLILAPVLLPLLVLGALYQIENPWLMKWLWWPIPLMWAVAFLVNRGLAERYWKHFHPDPRDGIHWTEHDRAAWKKVELHAREADHMDEESFFLPDTYLVSVTELARVLAQHYHPQTENALDSVTVPEVLAVAELAIADLNQLVERYVPGSRLITIRWWQRAARLPTLWKRVSKVATDFEPFYYAVRLAVDPVTTVGSFAGKKMGVDPLLKVIRSNSGAWLYCAFVLLVGKYLIELNSRRLKVGARTWRELMDPLQPKGLAAAPAAPAPMQGAPPQTLTIAVVGQVKAGKSSLINALIGSQQAAVDCLPATKDLREYRFQQEGVADELVLLDTPGYAHEGLTHDRLSRTMEAVKRSAMAVLVADASDPARQPDRVFLEQMVEWFGKRSHLKRPPVLVVLTHVDLLGPPLEWNPPYPGWVNPSPRRAKEQSIRGAVNYVQGVFGNLAVRVVPACTHADQGRLYGIREWVIPALLTLLPQAQAKNLIDILFAKSDQGRFLAVAGQLWNAAALLTNLQLGGPEAVVRSPEE